MATPVDTLKKEIQELNELREKFYVQFRDIEKELADKSVILQAFNLVSKDIGLYNNWQLQAKQTSAPEQKMEEDI